MGRGRAGGSSRCARIVACGCAAVLLLWAGATTPAFARSVSIASSVTVGHKVTVSVKGFRARSRVSVQLSPTATGGGNCCGVVAVKSRRVSRAGRARIRLVWPAAYFRCGGVGACSQVPWSDDEGAKVTVSQKGNVPGLASATTQVHVPQLVSPGVGGTWTAPLFSATLLRLDGGGTVPFGVVVDGTITGSATLVAGSSFALVGDPVEVYSIDGPAGKLAFSLRDATWTPPTGMTGPTTSVQLALAWPTAAKGTLRLPVLSASTTIGLNRPSAQIQLTGSLAAGLYTSFAQVAQWVLRRGYLSPSYQAAAIALYLQRALSQIARVYRFTIDISKLRAQILELLAQAVPVARALGVVLTAIGEALKPALGAVDVVLDKLGDLATSIYNLTIGQIVGRAAASGSATGGSNAPLGTRRRLTVRRASPARLRAGHRYRMTTARARTLAGVLLRPATGAHVGSQLVQRARGRVLSVAASGLSSDRVAITIVGPGYSAEAPLQTRKGVAAARLRLPRRAGRYRIGIADLAAPGGPRLAAATVAVRRGR